MSNPEQMSVPPATQSELPMQPADSDGTPETGEELIQRIGRLTRMLRDNMRESGLDREIERAAEAIPDARDRLNYVASTTEKAADRALNACERAQPLQDALASHAQGLSARWDAWYAQPVALDQARELVVDTRAYLSAVPEQAAATNAQLLEIMMAQDFQDLTGQVIRAHDGRDSTDRTAAAAAVDRQLSRGACPYGTPGQREFAVERASGEGRRTRCGPGAG